MCATRLSLRCIKKTRGKWRGKPWAPRRNTSPPLRRPPLLTAPSPRERINSIYLTPGPRSPRARPLLLVPGALLSRSGPAVRAPGGPHLSTPTSQARPAVPGESDLDADRRSPAVKSYPELPNDAPQNGSPQRPCAHTRGVRRPQLARWGIRNSCARAPPRAPRAALIRPRAGRSRAQPDARRARLSPPWPSPAPQLCAPRGGSRRREKRGEEAREQTVELPGKSDRKSLPRSSESGGARGLGAHRPPRARGPGEPPRGRRPRAPAPPRPRAPRPTCTRASESPRRWLSSSRMKASG